MDVLKPTTLGRECIRNPIVPLVEDCATPSIRPSIAQQTRQCSQKCSRRLIAVFEVASPSHYSEDFDRLRDNFALDFDINECVFLHVPRWARQIERLATGLRKVGQLDLAEYLERNVKPAPQEKNTGKASDLFSRLRIKIDRQQDDPK